jgi:hypothetical protein
MGGPYGGNGAGWQETGLEPYRMIRKSGRRFSEKTMRKQNDKA